MGLKVPKLGLLMITANFRKSASTGTLSDCDLIVRNSLLGKNEAFLWKNFPRYPTKNTRAITHLKFKFKLQENRLASNNLLVMSKGVNQNKRNFRF